MNNALIKLELLRLSRSYTAKAILLFALISSLYAVWSGISWREGHSQILANYEEQIAERQQSWLNALTEIENGEENPSPYAARPMDIRLAATQPVGPLGHMTIGHAELMPTRVLISPWRNQMSMVEPYEFDNPTTLVLGRFDLAFYFIVILPLLMIALSFDVIAADRARGTVKLLLSNPLSAQNIISSRLLVRNGLLLAISSVALIVGVSAAGQGSAGHAFFWLATGLVYFIFWYALIYLVVSRIKRSETAVASLIGLWAVFTLAVPALTGSAGEYLYPQPSKLEYLSDARVAQNAASKQTAELTKGFLADHPDLSVGDENVPSFYRRSYLANEQVLINTAPIVKAFEESNKNRDSLVRTLQYLSPAVIAQRALFASAGSDYEQSRAFLTQAADTLDDLSIQIRSSVLSRNRISSEEYAALPRFKFEATGVSTLFSKIAWPLVVLVALSGLLIMFARRKSASEHVL